jgi:hypothetical protein
LKEQVIYDSLLAVEENNYDIDDTLLCSLLPYLTESSRTKVVREAIAAMSKQDNAFEALE